MRPRARSRPRLHYQIYTNDNARTAADYRSLIIANRDNAATVRLGDVGNVTDMQDGATQNIRNFGIYNGKPAIQVQVFQQPGANIIERGRCGQGEIPQLKSEIDPKIDLA
jgi:multidrug efflux pump